MELNSEHDFLQCLDADYKSMLKGADWLLSDFDAPRWTIALESKELIDVDWRVSLENGLLTSEENQELLEGLKYYLILSVDESGDGLPAASTMYRRNFLNAMTIIDYLLLNSKSLELCTAGLAGLTKSNLTALLHQYGSHPHSSESIYHYSSVAENFMLNISAITPAWAIANIFSEFPSIKDVQEDYFRERRLNIDPGLIPTIRAALFYHGYYSGSFRKGYHINGKRISEELYPNTIAGTRVKPRLQWLSFFPHEKIHHREFDGVPVRYSGDGIISEMHYNTFRATLYRLGALHSLELPAPPLAAFADIQNFTVPVSSDKRFRSVPSSIILGHFKNCVEFHFKYGRMIIDGFCKLAAYCKANRTTMHRLSDKQLQKIIGQELVKIGVKKLGLACIRLTTKHSKPLKEEYYTKLRGNEGLIELLQIYIGCVQFVLGTLMARRYNELTELPLLQCLDRTKEWLVINLEKTSKGLYRARDTQARPIDPLPVSMIRLLIRLQRLLKRFGFTEDYKRLFSSPSTTGCKGLINASVVTWNHNLDIMADYFQTPLDKHGRRYYIRQHQLRRFFALMFFHIYGHRGINAIRWMLGHQDIEQIYRYIRANVDGASLQGALSQFVLEDMANGRLESYQDLADLLKEQFGTRAYGLYDEEEADLYIQSKLAEGSISIEPVFFTDENGKQMKIIVRVFNKTP